LLQLHYCTSLMYYCTSAQTTRIILLCNLLIFTAASLPFLKTSLSCDDHLEDFREAGRLSELFNAVLCTKVVHSHKHTYITISAVLTMYTRVFSSHVADKVGLISVSLALTQAHCDIADTTLVHHVVCLITPSFHWYSLCLPIHGGMARLS